MTPAMSIISTNPNLSPMNSKTAIITPASTCFGYPKPPAGKLFAPLPSKPTSANALMMPSPLLKLKIPNSKTFLINATLAPNCLTANSVNSLTWCLLSVLVKMPAMRVMSWVKSMNISSGNSPAQKGKKAEMITHLEVLIG